MGVLLIKQIIKTKVNKRDIEKALVEKLAVEVGSTADKVEKTVINTSEIPGVRAGGTVLLVSDAEHTKYIASTLGSSTKDCLCIDADGNEKMHSFEYTLWIDKKIADSLPVGELLRASGTNEDLLNALKMIGNVATTAKDYVPLHGDVAELGESKSKTVRFPAFITADYIRPEDKSCVDFSVVGKRGEVHLMQLVPITKDEAEILDYFDDRNISHHLALLLIKNKKGIYNNRKKGFNFGSILGDGTQKNIDTLDKLLELMGDEDNTESDNGEKAV